MFRLKFIYFLLSLILFFYAIIMAKEFLYPISFAILIAYLLFPLNNFLEKHNFPRILAIIISLILAFVVIFGTGFFIYKKIGVLVGDLPTLKKQALKNIDKLLKWLEGLFAITDSSFEQSLKQQVIGLFDISDKFLRHLFTATTGTLYKIFIIPVYIFLFLFYRTKFAYFILMLVSYKDRLITIKILRDISQIAARYLGWILIVILFLCGINTTGLLLIGVPYAIILGVTTAILTIIPYFGSILGGCISVLFALLTVDSPKIAFQVALFYVFVVFLEHNILTPNIVGNNVRVNPFIIIISLIGAAMIWGIPGMVVIVPFMAVLKVISKHVPRLKPYAFLLGIRGARRHSLYIPTFKEIILRRKKKRMHDDED